MTWARQVVHVAWKDARMLRWLLALTAVLAVLVALVALPASAQLAGFAYALLALCAIGAVAHAVQADSPVRADAFWVSRPLAPSAVMTAKLLMVAGVLGLAMLAVAGIMLIHDAPAGEYAAQLGFAAMVLGTLLASVLAIAAVTQDLRGFGFGWIVVLVGWIAAGVLVSLLVEKPIGTIPLWLVPLAVMGGGLIILAHQYATGRLMRSVLLLAFFGLTTSAATSVFRERSERPAPLPRLGAQIRPRGVAAAVFDAGTGASPRGLAVRIEGANPDYKYMLWDAKIEVTGNAKRSAAILPYAALTQFPPRVLGLSGVSWAGQQPGSGDWAWAHLGSWPTNEPGVIRAKLAVSQGTLLGRIPVEVGRSLVKSGFRMRIDSLSNGPDGAALRLRVSLAGAAADRFTSGRRNPNYMLLDVGRKLLFVLNSRSGGGSWFSPLLPAGTAALHLYPRQVAGVRMPQVGQDRLELIVVDAHNVGSDDITIPVERVTGAPPVMIDYGRAMWSPYMLPDQ